MEKSPFPIGASFINQTNLFLEFWERVITWSFLPIYSQLCPLVSEKKIFNEFIYIIMGKNSPNTMGASFIDKASLL